MIDQSKEQQLIAEMESILQEKMEKDYAQGETKRDAHPKTLGLMQAKFRVMEDIPSQVSQVAGIFSTPGEYQAWVRFSNASGSIQSDQKKDFRGIGIKLMGVEGERLNQDEKQTQDFLLMTYPIMPLGTVQLFRDAVYYSIKKSPLLLVLKFLFGGHASILKHLAQGKKHDTSPLDLNYWSTTPYRLGDTAVKYKLVPTSTYRSALPSHLTSDYLRDNMKKHLQNAPATFDFMIQYFKDEQTTPIEDAAIEWKEFDAPYIKVAELSIDPQDFCTARHEELSEALTFSPSNTLKANEPLGGINRARITIYRNLSLFRHRRNGKKLYEPLPENITKD
ncbi:catalase family protein [Porphyromonas pogonae]|uniref:catalase family protein n=1 Tax=Porphyromonas pogonae TaxID=867595 RepID=UPI002E76F9AE|nr:catalase family protein [Porphyromonas pogonae]